MAGAPRVLKGGKGNISEGGIRVPLIVDGPGIRGGVYCNEPVVGYDILPTVLDLAAPGFALPQGVEGGSWKPVLQNGGAGKVERPIDRLVFHMAVEVEHPQSAIRKGDLKLLHYWDTQEDFLYDLAADLGESPQPRPRTARKVAAQLLAGTQRPRPCRPGRRGRRGARTRRGPQAGDRRRRPRRSKPRRKLHRDPTTGDPDASNHRAARSLENDP